MQQIHITDTTPDWEDDVLSLSPKFRAIGWAITAAIIAVGFLPAIPITLKFVMIGVAGFLFLILNMDAGWRQKQSNSLRHTSEAVAHATGISASELAPALRTAAVMERTILADGKKLSIHREGQGFTITIVAPQYA